MHCGFRAPEFDSHFPGQVAHYHIVIQLQEVSDHLLTTMDMELTHMHTPVCTHMDTQTHAHALMHTKCAY